MTASSQPPRGGVGGRLLYGLMVVLGAWPLAWLQAAGARLGRGRQGRARAIVDSNLRLCFPGLGDGERAALADATLAEAGRSMLEAFAIWTRPRAMLRRIVEVRGQPLLDAARASGRGVLVLAPHLGAWELLNLHLARGGPGAVLYRAPASAALEWAIVRARSALGMGQVRADRQAPRTLLRRLAAGELIGILPDQQPRRGDGVFVPFFGVEALTMTLAPRLAQRATTLVAWVERLPRGRFRVHIVAAPAAVADPDPQRATAAMNAAIAEQVQLAPAQYAWTYKRFSLRPPGAPPRYGPQTRRRNRPRD